MIETNIPLNWKRLVFLFLGLLFTSMFILTLVSPRLLLGPAAGWAGIKIAMALIAMVLIVIDVVLLIGILRVVSMLVLMLSIILLIILFPIYFLVKWIFRINLFEVLSEALDSVDPSSGEAGADGTGMVFGILAIIISVAGWFTVIALWHL